MLNNHLAKTTCSLKGAVDAFRIESEDISSLRADAAIGIFVNQEAVR